MENKTHESFCHWSEEIYSTLRSFDIKQLAYVPDSGHAKLIEEATADINIITSVLTTEEEGIALLGGAWLGGHRGVLLMQSSGVGNCVNMLSLAKICQFPLLTLVTMRGEWGEFNPWQAPMARATQQSFEMMDIYCMRAETADDVIPTVRAAARQVFEGLSSTTVLISQRAIGSKDFSK